MKHRQASEDNFFEKLYDHIIPKTAQFFEWVALCSLGCFFQIVQGMARCTSQYTSSAMYLLRYRAITATLLAQSPMRGETCTHASTHARTLFGNLLDFDAAHGPTRPENLGRMRRPPSKVTTLTEHCCSFCSLISIHMLARAGVCTYFAASAS